MKFFASRPCTEPSISLAPLATTSNLCCIYCGTFSWDHTACPYLKGLIQIMPTHPVYHSSSPHDSLSRPSLTVLSCDPRMHPLWALPRLSVYKIPIIYTHDQMNTAWRFKDSKCCRHLAHLYPQPLLHGGRLHDWFSANVAWCQSYHFLLHSAHAFYYIRPSKLDLVTPARRLISATFAHEVRYTLAISTSTPIDIGDAQFFFSFHNCETALANWNIESFGYVLSRIGASVVKFRHYTYEDAHLWTGVIWFDPVTHMWRCMHDTRVIVPWTRHCLCPTYPDKLWSFVCVLPTVPTCPTFPPCNPNLGFLTCLLVRSLSVLGTCAIRVRNSTRG